ncbi:MAG: efflux transporter outer membrane subunit [Methylovirgula sp.]
MSLVTRWPVTQKAFRRTPEQGAGLYARFAARRLRSGVRTLGTIALALGLSACGLGPNFVVPPAPPVTGYTTQPLSGIISGPLAENQRIVRNLDIPGQWWTIFHSKPLNALIADALYHNPDLQAAQAALRRARENALAQQGGFYPQISGGFAGTGGNVGNVVSSPLASNAPAYSLLTPQVSVAYVPDVFGLRQREVESLDAATEMQRFRLEAAYLTLTSNVVAAAIQEASLRGQIDATQKIIRISQENLRILRRQRDLGQISDADVLLQEAALAQVEQTLPPLDRHLAQQRDLLTALTGRFPSQGIAETFDIDALRLPRRLPLSLPSKLVAQRPDIQAAEANLHAASAAIGVAIAARLPVINLTASYGNGSETLAVLFSPQTAMWAVTGSVTQSLFDGFSLYHRQKAAEAAFAEAGAQYRSTVISAFRNVADVLQALAADARTYRAAVAAATAARKSLDLTRKQLALGQTNSLTLLNAQQTYLRASLVQVQARAARYTDTAALFQALGGGWWNRSDVGPEAAASGMPSLREFLLPAAAKDQ